MQVLIVEKNHDLGRIWTFHLERQGASVTFVSTQMEAISFIRHTDLQVIVLNLKLGDESSFAIADYAAYRRPKAKVIFVTADSFFSDGSIFRHIPNACAYIQTAVSPDDLCAMVEYHGSVRHQSPNSTQTFGRQ